VISKERLNEIALGIASKMNRFVWWKNCGYEEGVTAVEVCNFARALLKAVEQESEVVAHEYKWLDTNEHTVTSGQWSQWERVVARNPICTVDDRVAEIQHYIDKGYRYELRKLIALPLVESEE